MSKLAFRQTKATSDEYIFINSAYMHVTEHQTKVMDAVQGSFHFKIPAQGTTLDAYMNGFALDILILISAQVVSELVTPLSLAALSARMLDLSM
jgi:hypothetical protein